MFGGRRATIPETNLGAHSQLPCFCRWTVFPSAFLCRSVERMPKRDSRQQYRVPTSQSPRLIILKPTKGDE